MPAWPGSLPAPSIDGYRLRPVDAVPGTGFDAGNRRARRHTAAAPTLVDVRWRFTQDEFADFEYFHDVTVAGGADAFTVSLVNGLGAQSYSAAFDGPWTASLMPGGGFLVSATLRIAAREILSADYLEAASTYLPDDIVYASDVLHTLIHTTLPESYW